MPRPPSGEGVARRNGRWGEDVAVEHLRAIGYVIVDRNVHPCPRDRRLEIDIVAYDKANDVMVFVEVKQHSSHSERERRLRSVDRRKLRLMRRACSAWVRGNRWTGSRRFDVVEVFGTPDGGRPEVDHVERVRLFDGRDRFVNWDA